MFRNHSRHKQAEMWIRNEGLGSAHTNPFYDQLKKMLHGIKFGDQLREICSEYYRREAPELPGVATAVCLKMLIIG